mmetsp:Transcript_24111/g.67043  ORF Transcript_24111/g.67043 Transcript_24111/m.67043 type:complete len:110 (-) Transcript_24111:57-386(-)
MRETQPQQELQEFEPVIRRARRWQDISVSILKEQLLLLRPLRQTSLSSSLLMIDTLHPAMLVPGFPQVRGFLMQSLLLPTSTVGPSHEVATCQPSPCSWNQAGFCVGLK